MTERCTITTILGCLAGCMLAMGAGARLAAEDFPSPGSGAMPANPWGTASGTIAGPPTAPGTAVRPDSWPGGPPAAGPSAPWPQPAGPLPPGNAMPCESAQTIARIPNDVVLTSDVMAITSIDDLVGRNKEKLPQAEFEKQRAEIIREAQAGVGQLVAHLGDPDPASFVDPPRRALIRQLLQQQIERKLVYQDFLRTVPKEAMPGIQQMIDREFDKMELPKLLKRENATARQDLEWKLRARGSSLEREKRMFMEQVVCEQWTRDKIKIDKEVTHEQLLSWYQDHLVEFEKPARVLWDEIMVSLAKHSNSGEAYAAIAEMGNQVVLGGVPLSDVARARSDGPTADHGGRRDWTTKGSLVSEELDRVLFTLPPGQLSPIIASPTGYHIIRVVQRQDAHRTPFLEAQKEVGEKIKQERTRKQYREYLTLLQKQFPVWTIFDATAKRTTPGQADDAARY